MNPRCGESILSSSLECVPTQASASSVSRRSVMTASRRDILLQGCAIGAGVIAANVPGIVALAQAGPFLRRSLHGIAANDPIFEARSYGVRILKTLPASHPGEL